MAAQVAPAPMRKAVSAPNHSVASARLGLVIAREVSANTAGLLAARPRCPDRTNPIRSTPIAGNTIEAIKRLANGNGENVIMP